MNEKCKQHVDSCRFCWMCRHICPIGNATGLERNTARARALGLSLVNRGVYDLADVADNIYECACCGACTKECVTGWDPVMFTKAARLDAALAGKLPPYIQELVDNCLETGNAYGKTEPDSALAAAIEECSAKTDILLFLGVDARYMAPESALRAIRVLQKAGVSFTVLAQEPASGQQLEFLIGAAEETRQQMTTCAEALSDFKTVIALDPQDAKVFMREYREWGVELFPEVKTFTAYTAQLLRSGALSVKKDNRHAVFQDPFQLARDLSETADGRAIVRACCICDEMLLHGKDTLWAGNILMAQWMPQVIDAVARDRICNAVNMHADILVTASVSEYTALKKVAQNKIEILSLEELILG